MKARDVFVAATGRRNRGVATCLLALLAFLGIGASGALAAAPTVTIDPASKVGLTTALVSGEVDPGGKETSWRFDYATAEQFGNGEWTEGGGGSVEAAAGPTPVETFLSLAPETTYYLRLVASNEDGNAAPDVAPKFTTGTVVAPALATKPVTVSGYTTATLEGTVDPEGGNVNPLGEEVLSIEWQLQYSLENEAGEPEGWNYAGGGTIEGAEAKGSAPIDVKAELGPGTLAAGEKYLTRVFAYYAIPLYREASSPAPFESFETSAAAKPLLSDPSAGSVTSTSAKLTAAVNPNAPKDSSELEGGSAEEEDIKAAFATDWHFELSSDSGSSWSPVGGGSLEADDDLAAVEAEPTLEPNRTYLVKLVASNRGGTTETAPAQFAEFTTSAVLPGVAGGTNTPLQPGETLVRAYVNTHNAEITECIYEYGLTTAYGQSAPCDTPLPNGNKPEEVTAHISGLEPGATYHFQVVVTTQGGTETSPDAPFGTYAEPEEPTCANTDKPGASFLPDCRAWEMVSPPDKNGADIISDSQRTRASVDGDAVGFISLGAFADGQEGASLGTDYIAQRSALADPGGNGWATHSILPKQEPLSGSGVTGRLDGTYEGEFSPDLSSGIVRSATPQTDDANVKLVSNLYRRDNLLDSSSEDYELLSESSISLPSLPSRPTAVLSMRPLLAGASPDLSQVAFESKQPLTSDTPPNPTGEPFPNTCDFDFANLPPCRVHLYEALGGDTNLAGRVPADPLTEDSCNDASGPVCVAADVSLGGQGTNLARNGDPNLFSPHVVSDGSDGHRRVFFLQPTDTEGHTSDELSGFRREINAGAFGGRLFARIDGTETVQINVDESVDPSVYGPARFLDASADGSRVFFRTGQALTDDASGAGNKLYMWSAKPDFDGHHLTYISDEVEATVGVSADGTFVYFTAFGQHVSGQPDIEQTAGIYLWHDGDLSFISRSPEATMMTEIITLSANFVLQPLQARVSPDGRHLLFSTTANNPSTGSPGPTGYDHGDCETGIGGLGCRELYLFDADDHSLTCASCNPSGASATKRATAVVFENSGAATTSFHHNHTLSDDGRYVFFSSAEPLLNEDTNKDTFDAYVYDARSGRIHLLSTGTDDDPSYFLDASPDGQNAFFTTREKLSGWDIDDASDLYDARVGGGFPEPAPVTAPCAGDSCRNPATAAPPTESPGTSAFAGSGNQKPRRCPKGKRRVVVRGKSRCVKKQPKRHHPQRKRANDNRRAGK